MYNTMEYTITGNGPLILSRSDTLDAKFIKRVIDKPFYDVISIYPFHSFNNIKDLFSKYKHPNKVLIIDENNFRVSTTFVTDPMIPIENDPIFDYFKEYKTHYIIDYSKPIKYSNNHKRNIKNNKNLEMELLPKNSETADKFHGFYQVLKKKHGITGITDFNLETIYNHISHKNSYTFGVWENNKLIGSIITTTIDDRSYYHLGAYSERGYEIGASFSLMDHIISFYNKLGYKYFILGAGAGVDKASEGLVRFKKGFSNDTRKNYIIGYINNREKYDELSKGKEGDFFPLYRS